MFQVYLCYGIYFDSAAHCTFANSTFSNNEQDDLYFYDSNITSINSTWGSIDWGDDDSILYIKNYLHIKVLDKDGSTPIEGADILIKSNGETEYATAHFDRNDSKTGSDGYVRWIPVTYKTLTSAGATYYTANVTVWNETYKDDFYDNPRDVNMSKSRTEEFTAVPEFGEVFVPVCGVVALFVVLRRKRRINKR